MTSSTETQEKYSEAFIPPIEGERPACPWPQKFAWKREDAERVAAEMRAHGHPDIRAYFCEGCRYWHTGKNKAAFEKRVRQVLSSADHRQRLARRRRKKR